MIIDARGSSSEQIPVDHRHRDAVTDAVTAVLLPVAVQAMTGLNMTGLDILS